MTECGVAEKIGWLMESCLGCPAEESDCPLNAPLLKAQRKLEAIQVILDDESFDWKSSKLERIKQVILGVNASQPRQGGEVVEQA